MRSLPFDRGSFISADVKSLVVRSSLLFIRNADSLDEDAFVDDATESKCNNSAAH